MPIRDSFQDIAKALAIILVVYGHMARGMADAGLVGPGGWFQLLDFTIYTFHMPLFFLLAGYNAFGSLYRHGWPDYLLGKGWGIVYPYFLWSAVLVLAKIAASAQVNHRADLAQLLEIPYSPISPFWFLYVLMIVNLVTALLRRSAGGLFAISVILFFGSSFWPGSFPGVLESFARYFVFFAAGYLVANGGWSLHQPVLSNGVVLLACALLLSMGGWMMLPLGLSPVGVATIPLSIIGMSMILGIAQRLDKTRKKSSLVALGRLSLVVFLMHVIFTAWSRAIMTKLGITSFALMTLVGTFTSIALSIILYIFLSKLGLARWAGLNGRSPLSFQKVEQMILSLVFRRGESK